MRKDIKAINEAYEQARRHAYNTSQPQYNINGNIITVYNIPTYTKGDNTAPTDITYVFRFESDDLTDDLTNRDFKMYANDQEVNPQDYEQDDIFSAATEAIKILMHEGEVDRTH